MLLRSRTANDDCCKKGHREGDVADDHADQTSGKTVAAVVDRDRMARTMGFRAPSQNLRRCSGKCRP